MIKFEAGEKVAMYDGGKRTIVTVYDGLISHAGLLIVHTKENSYFPHIKQLRKLKQTEARSIWIYTEDLENISDANLPTIFTSKPTCNAKSFTKFIEAKR